MFIARTDKFDYLGFDDNYHKFKDKNKDSLVLVTQAKVIDVEADIAFVLKEGGVVEASYAAARVHSQEEIDISYKKLFGDKQGLIRPKLDDVNVKSE